MLRECINDVMTAKTKGTYIQFRVREDMKDDVQTVAELRGLSMSALIHSLLMKAIREEKELSPNSFAPSDKRLIEVKTIKPTATPGQTKKQQTG